MNFRLNVIMYQKKKNKKNWSSVSFTFLELSSLPNGIDSVKLWKAYGNIIFLNQITFWKNTSIK